MAPCTQVLLRTQVITRVSIVYKGKEQLLQLHCHHVRHVLKPPTPGTSGKFTDSEKLPSPWSGYGHRETPGPVDCPHSRHPSPSQRALNSLPLVSSATLTPLVCYVCELRLHNLKNGTQFPRMHSAISRLCKFLDCVEHIYMTILEVDISDTYQPGAILYGR